MPATREKGNAFLLALLWALTVASLCVSLGAPSSALPQGQTVAWTRTMPDTGVWFLAAAALGLGYAALGRVRNAFARPGLWLVAALAAGVATLGESFALYGTAEALTANAWLALLYFAGRVPAYYGGMALLLDSLARAGAPGGSREGYDACASARDAGASQTRTCRRAEEPLAYTAPEEYRRNVTATAHSSTPRSTAAALGEGETAYVPGAPYPGGAQASGAPGSYAAESQPIPAGAAVPPYPLEGALGHAGLPKAAARYAVGPGTVRAAGPVNLTTGMFALLLLLCWLPYLIAIWPGTVSNDSITQLAELFGRKPLGNGNPLFQTGLLWAAVSLGEGLFGSADAAVALYCVAQGLLMAWLLGYTLRRMGDAHAPGWLRGLATAFFALCPIFPVFAFCVGKDTNFAMATLWLTLMAWRVMESRWPPFRTVAGLCLSAALCALLRNAGAVLAGVTLLALLLESLVRGTRQWRAPALALLVTGAAVAFLYLTAIPSLQAEATPATENWSVPLQQVARIVASEALTPEERAAIDAVLPVDEIQPAYNGELSDPVKALWRAQASPEAQRTFWGTWFSLCLKHPATALSATFHNSYGYLLPGYVSTLKPTFLLGMEGRTTLIDGAFDFTVNPAAVSLKQTLTSLFTFVPFRLLTSPGGYGLLTLFALAGLLACNRRAYALCALPAVLTLLGCLFSAVNGYYRYAMPLYFCAPALLALLSQAARGGLRYGRAKRGATLPQG